MVFPYTGIAVEWVPFETFGKVNDSSTPTKLCQIQGTQWLNLRRPSWKWCGDKGNREASKGVGRGDMAKRRAFPFNRAGFSNSANALLLPASHHGPDNQTKHDYYPLRRAKSMMM